MANRRALARGGARIAAGVIGVAVAAATIGAATLLPLPSVERTPLSVQVRPVPADQQRVCPGGLLELGADASASSISAFAAPQRVDGSVGGAVDGAVSRRGLKPVGVVAGAADAAPAVIDVAPSAAGAAPQIAGAQSQTAAREVLAGLAAASCTEANADSWLVGGATTLGQTSLVLLSNPSAVQATVDLSVYSESGILTAPGAQGIVVDPGTQRIVPLAGIAPNAQAPVVHVESAGGTVAASLQQSLVRGIKPSGVDVVGPTAQPARQQLISGMIVSDIAAAQSAGGSEGSSSAMPAVRVLAPGRTAAKVTVSVVPENGKQVGTTTSATVPAGTVQELPLDKLVDGAYTVSVNSDQPIVVAARTTDIRRTGEDFGWFAASPRLADSILVPVAPGPAAALHLANPGAHEVTVHVPSDSGAGPSTAVTVPAGGGTSVALGSPGRTVVLHGTAGLVASVGLVGVQGIASYPLAPAGPQAQQITVYPR
ncbi:MAG TPA: DUF5719 family protein [Humibacter sp.]|nr:DUF5719 family protein [Humibacter sp.]